MLVTQVCQGFMKGGAGLKGCLSIREASCKRDASERRVNQVCSEGRIPGAERFGRSWAIPEYADKPKGPRKDRRRKQ